MKRTVTPTRLMAASPAIGRLMDEAQAAEKAGRPGDARQRFENVLYLLAASEGGIASTILRRIAATYIEDGDFDAALDCASAAEGVSEAMGDMSGVAYAYNLKGSANLQRGDHARAGEEYERARALAEQVGDRRLLALISQNLGVIAGWRGDLDTALEHFAESMRSYSTLGLEEYLASLLNNMGMVYAQFGRWEDAESSYLEALARARDSHDTSTALTVRVNLLDIALARGETADAAVQCDEVLAEARRIGDARALGELTKHQGVIARRLGRLAEAERHLFDAYESAMQREDLRLAATAMQEQAFLYDVEGRDREALQALLMAHALFGRIGARRDAARVEDRLLATVQRWAELMELRATGAIGHARRVAEQVGALAARLGHADMAPPWLQVSALLHDIGKVVAVTDEVAPIDLIRRHPDAGVDLLRDIDIPPDVLEVIRSHHEHWDGSGYPRGLAGDAIPRAARILQVVDAFDGLVTGRPGAMPLSDEEALRAIEDDAGKRFDPEVVREFRDSMRWAAETPPAVGAQSMVAAGRG